MSSIFSVFTISRIGSHVRLDYKLNNIDKIALWPANQVETLSIDDNLFKIGIQNETISLNYTLATDNTSNSISSYIKSIQDLINISDLGFIDDTNSTSIALAANSTYTGTWKNVTNYSEFTCLMSTDQRGEIKVNFSEDAVSIDRTDTRDFSESGGVYTYVVSSKYIKVTIENGKVSQSFFRLQTILNEYRSVALTSNMNQIVSDKIGVQLVRDPSIPEWDLAREFYEGRSSDHFFGNDLNVGITWEDIWSHDGNYPFQTTSSIMDIYSDDANDDGYSTGTLTFSEQPIDGDTITIGITTYTFQDTLIDIDKNIHIGTTTANTILNTIDAITLSSLGEGPGVGYATNGLVNLSVTAVSGVGDTIDLISLGVHDDGDIELIPTTETSANLSFGASEMVIKNGCLAIELHGLDINGTDSEEIIILNGLTKIQTTNSYLRINKMHLQTVGSPLGANFGNIHIEVTNNGDLQGIIKGFEVANINTAYYGHGELGMGRWSVPLGEVIYLTQIEANIGEDAPADIILYEAEGLERDKKPYLPRRIVWGISNVKGHVSHHFKTLIKVKQNTDIYFRARSHIGTTPIEVKCQFYRSMGDSKGK